MKRSRRHWLPKVLAVLAGVALLIAVGAAVYAPGHSVRHYGGPSTTPVSADEFANYHVPPNQPRYIFIPRLKVRAIVLSLGTTASNQVESPPNVHQTGWYNRSGLPGQPGAMLIDGHVSSWTARGVFYGLKTLVKGDIIQIERGDGARFTYKVVASRTYNAKKVDMAAALRPVTPGKPGLNLITCTGQVAAGTSEFNQRVVVFAVQI